MKVIGEQVKEVKEEIFKKEEIKDTPFMLIGNEEGWFIVMGKYRLTEAFEHKKDAKKSVENITWNRVVQVMMIIAEIETNKNK